MLKKKYIFIIVVYINLLSMLTICNAGDLKKYYTSNEDLALKLIELNYDINPDFLMYVTIDALPFAGDFSGRANALYSSGFIGGKYKLFINEEEIKQYKKSIKITETDGMILRFFEPNEKTNRGVIAEAIYKSLCLISDEAKNFNINAVKDFFDEDDCVGREKAIKYMFYKGYMNVNANNEFKPFECMEYSKFRNLIFEIRKDFKKERE